MKINVKYVTYFKHSVLALCFKQSFFCTFLNFLLHCVLSGFSSYGRQINENTSGTTWFDGSTLTDWTQNGRMNQGSCIIADGINSNYENQIQFMASRDRE